MTLNIDEGRIYGSRYYTIQPRASIRNWFDMENWCIETFGPTPKDGVWTPNARWYANNAKFWFREQKDLEWFLLKWS
jgi:hypothetical protein